MADLMREHAQQLSIIQLTNQAIGQRDHRLMWGTYSKGIENPTGHIIQRGHAAQTGTLSEDAQCPA